MVSQRGRNVKGDQRQLLKKSRKNQKNLGAIPRRTERGRQLFGVAPVGGRTDCSFGLEKSCDKMLRVKLLQIIQALAQTDKADRDLKLVADTCNDTTLGGAVQFG